MASDTTVSEWADFSKWFRGQWQQGEHVSIIGSTGTGKSVLENEILSLRRYVILLATKGEDKELSHFVRKYEYRRITRWEPHKGKPSAFDERIALWPNVENAQDFQRLGQVFYNAINGYTTATRIKVQGIFSQGRWTLGLDEVSVLARHLNLGETLTFLWTQARSKLISIVGGTQRPRWVPREMLSEPTHLFLFNSSDEDDIQRLGEIGGRRVKEIQRTVPELPPFHFLYINKRIGTLAVSKVRR